MPTTAQANSPTRFVPLTLLISLLCCSPTANCRAAQDAHRRHNIVFVLVDDLGWKDLACQGNPIVQTPHIDQFARQGMRFTDAYSAAPVCSPTRAAILTGKSPARLHLTNHVPDRFVPKQPKILPAECLDYLPAEHVTIAERLKQQGYATAFIGKWHVAGRAMRGGLGDERFYPEQQGFDVNIGGCAYGGPPSYFAPYKIHNLPDKAAGEYLTDRLADEVISFIKRNRQQPFFVHLSHYTVHWPMQPKPEVLKKYAGRKGPGMKDARYAAMTETLDTAFGRILATLKELHLEEQTLVVFTSDNGAFGGVSDLRPLRAAKGYLYEGGIRVPLLIRWPGVVAPGSVCHEPTVSMDFFPTMLAAAGITLRAEDEIDGKSLVPLFTAPDSFQRKQIYFHYPSYAFHLDNRLGSAVREGPFKLIKYYDDGSVELYNLEDDIGERRNLAKSQPELAQRLEADLKKWLADSGANMPRPVSDDATDKDAG